MLLTLSLGPKFTPINNDIDLVTLAADVIHIIDNKIPNNLRKKTTTDIFKLIKKKKRPVLQKQSKKEAVKKYIKELQMETKNFLDKNLHLMITLQDKGNATVILEEKEYKEKMYQHLSNKSIYVELKTSSHKSFIKRNKILLEKLEKINYIPKGLSRKIYREETFTSKIYGLIKTHKENMPIRPINAKINTPGTKICEIVNDVLTKIANPNIFDIKNTTELINDLKQVKLKNNDKLYSLDIESMFTNIPADLALEIILEKDITKFTKIPIELFRELFNFITVYNTEFQFDNKTFKQIRGLFMGSKTSPVIAQITTNHILQDCFKKREIKPTFIKKYVDDIILITNPGNAKRILEKLNRFNPNIKFTLETETNNQLNYLDITIIRENNTISTKWYSKEISSKRLINYYSDHSEATIINTATQYIKNMYYYSDKKYEKEITEKAKEILYLNSFPHKIVSEIIASIQDKQTIEKHKLDIEYKGMTTNSKLTKEINHIFSRINTNIKIANRTTQYNFSNSLFNKNKDTETINNKPYLIIEIICNTCKFNSIEAILSPIIILEIQGKNKNHRDHPYFKLCKHQESSKHTKYKTNILRECKNEEEMWIAYQYFWNKKKKEIPFKGRQIINNQILKLITQPET